MFDMRGIAMIGGAGLGAFAGTLLAIPMAGLGLLWPALFSWLWLPIVAGLVAGAVAGAIAE